MDIREDDTSRGINQLFPTWGKVFVIMTIVFTIAVFLRFGVRYGVISSVSVLVSVGAVTTDSWNRELRSDGYASLSQLYSSYLASLFLFIAISPTLAVIYDFRVAIPLSLAITFGYVLLLTNIAYRGVEKYETTVETYHSPAVAYLTDGPYIEHIEQVAFENRSNKE